MKEIIYIRKRCAVSWCVCDISLQEVKWGHSTGYTKKFTDNKIGKLGSL